MNWDFAKAIQQYYDDELNRIELVRQSIKHPHIYYAEYNIDTGEVVYKKKRLCQRFSGKRIVHIKIGGPIYADVSSNDGKQRR